MTKGSKQARVATGSAPGAGIEPDHALGDNQKYVPGHGDERFDVLHYDIELDLALAGNHVRATAKLRARARCPLDRFTLDLHRLKVGRVSVDGVAAAKVNHRGSHLTITPAATIPSGAEFTVVVKYSGSPRQMRGPDGLAGWEELEDGLIVASQPHGSPSWYPCNDRPDNKASYRFTIITDNHYQVVANGTAMSSKRRSSRTTWVFDQPEPMASYLATLQIGKYATTDITGCSTPIRVYYPPARSREVTSGPMMLHARMVSEFSHLFGPYPFGRYDVVVTDDELEIPLEAQTLSIFGSNFLSPGWANERLIAHELAHQWFGNSLTLAAWRDIWLHEGFACHSEWLWSEVSGQSVAQWWAQEHHARLSQAPQDLVLADPGPEFMFDDRVYKRGALTLHALRLHLGDQEFFALLRAWCQAFRFSSVSTQEFIAFAERHAGVDPQWFTPWLYEKPLPPLG